MPARVRISLVLLLGFALIGGARMVADLRPFAGGHRERDDLAGARQRFETLAARLPTEGVVTYVAARPNPYTWYRAQYFLAPRIVRHATKPPDTSPWFEDE